MTVSTCLSSRPQAGDREIGPKRRSIHCEVQVVVAEATDSRFTDPYIRRSQSSKMAPGFCMQSFLCVDQDTATPLFSPSLLLSVFVSTGRRKITFTPFIHGSR